MVTLNFKIWSIYKKAFRGWLRWLPTHTGGLHVTLTLSYVTIQLFGLTRKKTYGLFCVGKMCDSYKIYFENKGFI